MRRKAVIAVLIILCFILQCTVFQALALAGISPNLLLIVTTSLGFMRGEKEGMAVGFFCGLLTDIFFGSLFGFYALLYMFLGYGSGLFHMMFYDEDIKLPMVWIALSELVYGLSVYFFMFLMRSKFDFWILFYAYHPPGAGLHRGPDPGDVPADPASEPDAGEMGGAALGVFRPFGKTERPGQTYGGF